MPTKTGVRVETVFAHPVEEVWPRFADFAESPKMAGVQVAGVTGSGVGAVRHVLVGEGFADERLEIMDHAGRRVVYSIVDRDPSVNIEDYVAEMAVTPIDASSCRFRWESTFSVPDGDDPEQARERMRKAYGFYIEGFRAALARGSAR